MTNIPRLLKDIENAKKLGKCGIQSFVVHHGGEVEDARFELDQAILEYAKQKRVSIPFPDDIAIRLTKKV